LARPSLSAIFNPEACRDYPLRARHKNDGPSVFPLEIEAVLDLVTGRLNRDRRFLIEA
jgi:hypothetical protein